MRFTPWLGAIRSSEYIPEYSIAIHKWGDHNLTGVHIGVKKYLNRCTPFIEPTCSKLMGFWMSWTLKHGDGNPILGPGFSTGNPGIFRPRDSLKFGNNGISSIESSPWLCREYRQHSYLGIFWQETQKSKYWGALCMVGSYASLAVCLSRLDQKSDRKY